MSGIAGIINFDGSPIEQGLVEKMTTALAHRGPDGIRHWIKGSVALGHCMLHTTTESLEEEQPLAHEDGSLVLVMDGRVDNWQELRRELLTRNAVLRSRSDAELVLRAYETWGRECLRHIDGDFALVIWDARRRQAFCARDRMGHKPFNYHWNGRTLVFASELHAILKLPWVTQTPNEGIIAEFLSDEFYSHDETMWLGILRLVAAHCMVVENAKLQSERYWQPDPWLTLPYRKNEEYVEHYRELFSESVRRVSRSHRRVACEVSGGLDSSAIFCMAEHLRRKGKLVAPAMDGYTLSFDNDADANEIDYARAVGDFLGVVIEEIPPTVVPLEWYAERAKACQDHPGFPNGVMHLGIIQRASIRGSRVVLDGLGGDEWLGGSRLYYAEELTSRHWSKLAESFKSDRAAFGTWQTLRWFCRHGLFRQLPDGFRTALVTRIRRMREPARHSVTWLSSDMRKLIGQRRALGGRQREGLARADQDRLDRNFYNRAYLEWSGGENERLAAEYGIESRRPLDTAAIAQFAYALPARLGLRGDISKWTHRQALAGLLPPQILERKSKAAFNGVFHRHLGQMQPLFMKDLPARRPTWFSAAGMAELFESYKKTPDNGSIWVLWGIHVCDKLLSEQ